MKIAVIYPEKLPTKKARTISVVNSAAALSKLTKTSLLYEKSQKSREEILSFYNQEDAPLNMVPLSKRFFFRSNKIFNLNLVKHLNKFDIFYVRHLKSAKFILDRGGRVIFESHEIFSKTNPKMKELERDIYKKSDGVVFINKTLQKEVNRNFKIDGLQRVIHNGCGFELDYIEKEFSKLAEVYYIGSFQPWKGVDFLIEAMRFFPHIKLKIVGDGDRDRLLKIINRFKLKNIEFLGFKSQREIEKLLKEAKVTLIPNTPSQFVNFSAPLKLYEYLMSSNIVLASDMPTIKEIIRDGDNGFLFKTGDINSFVDRLNYILSLNPNRLKEIAKRGYQDIQKYTWDNRAKEILLFAKEILSRSEIK